MVMDAIDDPFEHEHEQDHEHEHEHEQDQEHKQEWNRSLRGSNPQPPP